RISHQLSALRFQLLIMLQLSFQERSEEFSRRPDVNHVNLAEPCLGWGKTVARARGHDASGVVRANGRAKGLTGIAIESAGDIDSEDLPGCGVDGCDHAIQRAPDRAAQASTKKTIYNPFGRGKFFNNLLFVDCWAGKDFER